ncbi:MAG: Holliday junction resolvase RuvX [Porticoccaceae bacterium]|nr:Holliday junction resolvase RuvX [Porticoccaceae bacterium]
MAEARAAITALAFDYGVKQIGIAVGQTLTGTAAPVTVIKAQNGQPDWQQLEKILHNWAPGLLLVGLPLNMDGSESEFCLRARKFARRLQGRFGIKTQMVDERLSTREAKSRDGYRESYRSSPIDNIAAQIILEAWLNDPSQACEP